MPDTTSVDPTRFRELTRILLAEEKATGARTPAGALTTIAEALGGSLLVECHGAVAEDVLDLQADVSRGFGEEVGALLSAVEQFEEQERANAAALGEAGPPR